MTSFQPRLKKYNQLQKIIAEEAKNQSSTHEYENVTILVKVRTWPVYYIHLFIL
jgi:hypothetical protein